MGNWKLGEPFIQNANPNILEGLPAIATFLGKSKLTVRRWIFSAGLPVTKLPNGRWFSHKGLILQWIYAGHQAELKARSAVALEPESIAELAVAMNVSPDEVFNHEESAYKDA